MTSDVTLRRGLARLWGAMRSCLSAVNVPEGWVVTVLRGQVITWM